MRSRLHDWVGREEVRWREHIKDLSRSELHNIFMLLGNTLDTSHGTVPPLLLQ